MRCAILMAVAGISIYLPRANAQTIRSASERTNDSIVYHGKLVKPDGKVVEGSVAVTIQIFSPEPSLCLLWAESQTLNAVKGGFSMEIGNADYRLSSAGGGASNFRDVFLNHSGLSIASPDCEVGSSYTPSANDDRLMTATFVESGKTLSVERIPIKSVPFAKQASEIGGYGSANLMRISGAGSAVEFTPAEVQSLKDMLGGTINWDLGSERITNVADPVGGTDATNKQWVIDYVANNGGGGGGAITSSDVVTALGYTPVSATSPSEVIGVLGYTPLDSTSSVVTNALQNGGNSGAVVVGSNDSASVSIETANAPRVTVLSDGKVGIGTTSPLSLLSVQGSQVGGTNSGDGLLRIENTNDTLGNIASVIFSTTEGYGVPVRRAQIVSGVTTVNGDTGGFLAFSTRRTSSFNERMRIDNQGQVGIGTTSPASRLDVAGTIRAQEICDEVGANCKDISAGWGGGASGTVTSVAVSGAPLSVTNASTSPEVSISQASGTTPGFVSAADWTAFNNKLGSATAFSGDVGGQYNSTSVDRIKGTEVSATAPTSAGQVLRYNGTTQYAPAFLSLSDIRSTVTPGNTMFPSSSCTAGQTMTWVSLTDTMTCTAIAIGDSAITYASKAQNAVLAGPATGGAGVPTFRALAAADIPSLDWSKITGEPTTLAGYGISDSVVMNGGQSGAVTVGSNDSNLVNLRTNGSNRMTLYSSGYVGVGATSPTTHFSVSGGPVVAEGTLRHQLAIVDNQTAYNGAPLPIAGLSFQGLYNASNLRSFAGIHGGKENAGDFYKGYLAFFSSRNPSGPLEGMRLDSVGNVGIGTNSPVTRLHVRDTGDSRIRVDSLSSAGTNYQGFEIRNSGNLRGAILHNEATGNIEIWNPTSGILNLTSAGNVGIGTTSPNAKLQVAGGLVKVASGDSGGIRGDTSNSWLVIGSDSGSTGMPHGTGSHIVLRGSASTQSIEFYQNTARNTTFHAGGGTSLGPAYSGADPGANNMILSGNVGIGTTSPSSKLEVAGVIHSSGGGFKFPDGSTQTTAAGSGGNATYGTLVNATGTAVDFLGIPSSVTEIQIFFDGVSMSSADEFLIQIGDSGGFQNSGYFSAYSSVADTGTSAYSTTTGFGLRGGTATRVYTGTITLSRLTASSNRWIMNGSIASSAGDGPRTTQGAGAKTLTSGLDRIRITTSLATSFDSGQFNIVYK